MRKLSRTLSLRRSFLMNLAQNHQDPPLLNVDKKAMGKLTNEEEKTLSSITSLVIGFRLCHVPIDGPLFIPNSDCHSLGCPMHSLPRVFSASYIIRRGITNSSFFSSQFCLTTYILSSLRRSGILQNNAFIRQQI